MSHPTAPPPPPVAFAPPPAVAGPLRVEPWPTELPLRILVTLFALGIWLLLAITIFGFLYAALIGVFLFFVHLAFITHLRGSAVRLGPQQFPELYARVTALAQRAGLSRMPEVYLLESGGSLNALATRFFRSRMVVLFTDLLEACGDDEAARDMVIGHELGHLKAGHLDWHLLLLPGSFVPFLGSAYSRAREHTCDRWGAALCGDPAGAVRGLAILAAGGKFGPQVNLTAYVAQQQNLDTGWMTLGRWLDPYPPLSARIAALEPRYAAGLTSSVNGPLLAMGILFGVFVAPIAGVGIGAAVFIPMLQSKLQAATSLSAAGMGVSADLPTAAESEAEPAVDEATARLQVERDFDQLEATLRQWHAAEGQFPGGDDFGTAWQRYGEGDYLEDPFDGSYYGYYVESSEEVVLYSSGPDATASTDDDIQRRIRA